MQQPIEWMRGHITVRPFGGAHVRSLIDTGAEYSTTHRDGDSYLGVTLSDIEKQAGFDIDALIGLDAFDRPVLMTKDFIEFGAKKIDGQEFSTGPTAIEIPSVLATKQMTRGVSFFDSGASQSYVDRKVAGQVSGWGWDFFPPVGEYETTLHEAKLVIGEKKVPFIGAVSDKVQVTWGNRHSLIGSELLKWADVWIDLPNGKIVIR